MAMSRDMTYTSLPTTKKMTVEQSQQLTEKHSPINVVLNELDKISSEQGNDDEPNLFSACAKAYEVVNTLLNFPEEEYKNSELLIRTKKQIRLTISILEDAFQKFNLDELAISFNGGKDCLVMMVIILALLHKNHESKLDDFNIQTVYVYCKNSFPQLESFVDDCITSYSLDLTRLPGPLKEGFGSYLSLKPSIKAIIVGIRRNDPYGGKLEYIQKTDHGWPDFIRVHPVLEWHYDEIWCFLKMGGIPYCQLYDEGYTSLGGLYNTKKNPYLKTDEIDEEGNTVYKPAYELTGDEHERLGRH